MHEGAKTGEPEEPGSEALSWSEERPGSGARLDTGRPQLANGYEPRPAVKALTLAALVSAGKGHHRGLDGMPAERKPGASSREALGATWVALSPQRPLTVPFCRFLPGTDLVHAKSRFWHFHD